MNIGEFYLSQYIILHSQARAIWHISQENIHQYACNNPILKLFIINVDNKVSYISDFFASARLAIIITKAIYGGGSLCRLIW